MNRYVTADRNEPRVITNLPMDKQFLNLVHSFHTLRSGSLGDIESQFSRARTLVMDHTWRKEQYGLLTMGVRAMVVEFLKLMGTHKYCGVQDRTPEKRALNNILATLDTLVETICKTEEICRMYQAFTSCGDGCYADGGSGRKCMNQVGTNRYYAEMGIRMKVGNVPFDVEPLTRHQLSSIRAYKMAPPGTRVENVVKRSFVKN